VKVSHAPVCTKLQHARAQAMVDKPACSLEIISQISQLANSVFLSKKPTNSTFSQPDQPKRTTTLNYCNWR
jgi:hypothetical protein